MTTSGRPDEVAAGMREFAARYGADELIAVAHVYDHAARVRSYELTAAAWGLSAQPVATVGRSA